MSRRWDVSGNLINEEPPKRRWDEQGNEINSLSQGNTNPAKQLMKGVEAKKTPLGFVGNIFSSGANLAGNIAKLGMGAIEKPVRNVSEYVVERPIAKSEEEKMFDSAIGAPVGLLEKFASRPIAETIVGRKITPSWQEQQADAAIAGLKQRYGGIQNIKDTIYDDPVGVAMDVSMLAGGASGALRGASAVARGAELGRTAEVLGRGAEVAKTVATKTNPLTAPGRVIQTTREVTPAIKTAIQDRMFPGDPHQMAIQAIKPRASKLDFSNTLKSAMPDIKAAETKPITGVADTLDTVKAAKAANRVAYDKFRDPANQRGTVVDMSPVADSMDSNIPHDLQFEAAQGVPDAVAAVDAIKRRAAAYRTQIPLVDAEKQLLAANARLDEFYAKYPRQQWKSLATNPETASIYAKAQSLRDAIYNALDNENGGAGARELQVRYGKLLEVEQELQRRKNVAARQQPQSLAQQVSKANAAGKLALGLGQAAIGKGGIGSILSGAEGLVIKGPANWLKEQQTADALLSRAFRNYKMPQSPFPKFVEQGLLESGPRRMPPRIPLALPPAPFVGGIGNMEIPEFINRQVLDLKMIEAPQFDRGLPLGSPDPFRQPNTFPSDLPREMFPLSTSPEPINRPGTSGPSTPARPTAAENADFIKKFLIPEKKVRNGAKTSLLDSDPLGLFAIQESRRV